MILEKQKENLELRDGEVNESYATVIDFDSADFLKQMLSKFYADAVGSLVRETVSNALDSHRELGIEAPIIVSFGKNTEGQHEFSVEDVGVGIDKDTINNILRKYGKSTKRQAINQLGAFGLGFKSPLSYTSSFYFIGRKNGIEIKCMMYEGEEDIKIDILHEKKTKEPNGCKIIVPVKWADVYEFQNKIKEQLAYFESVYFNITGFDNEFKIHRAEHYQYSELCQDKFLHICLDNVYYPIDYKKLGIDPINVPLGLKFSLTDGIYPVPNRESLKYTVEAKELILNKIKLIADEFVNKYNENICETEDVRSVISHFSSKDRWISIIEDINIHPLLYYSTDGKTKNPTIKGLNILKTERVVEIKQYLFKEYQREYSLNHGRFSEEKYWKDLEWNDFASTRVNYLFSDRFTALRKDYLRSLHPNTYGVNIIKKRPYYTLGSYKNKANIDYKTYYSLLQLHTIPKDKWRDAIKEIQYVIDLCTKDGVRDFDKIVIPQSFIDGRKKVKLNDDGTKRKKELGEVSGKVCVSLLRDVYGKNSKLGSDLFKLDTIHRNNYTIVYGKQEDVETLDKLFGKINKNVRLVVFSERELKKIEALNVHNLISLEKFMKGETKIFKRIVTAYLINELKINNRHVFDKVNGLKLVSEGLANKIEELESYRSKWYRNMGHDDVIKTMLEIAEANNSYDESIYTEYLEMKKTLEKLKFLNQAIYKLTPSYYVMAKGSIEITILCDLFKYYKQKLNIDNYEPVKTEQVVEEVEELVETI